MLEQHHADTALLDKTGCSGYQFHPPPHGWYHMRDGDAHRRAATVTSLRHSGNINLVNEACSVGSRMSQEPADNCSLLRIEEAVDALNLRLPDLITVPVQKTTKEEVALQAMHEESYAHRQ
jgi:hypothetical protein